MKNFKMIILLLLTVSCNEGKKDLNAEEIIDKAIEKAGGDKYDNAKIAFSFRGTEYTSEREEGIFSLTRSFTDSIGKIEDIISNSGFRRLINAEEISIADSMETKYSNSVNSVHYFVQVPYVLDAPAVQEEIVGESEIAGKYYYEVKVTFRKEGGGTDHEDQYMYWISKEDFTIDYLAYRFFVEEGGIRFRKAYNPRYKRGIRFVDYKNYKYEPWKQIPLRELDELFESGKMEFVSDIKTENISVN